MEIDQYPILIAGPPRSGTTMLAGLLHQHGVWVGHARTTRYPGSNSNFGSENIDIKGIMKREAKKVGYKNWKIPLPESATSSPSDVLDELRGIVPPRQRWLVKTSWTLVFYKLWDALFPNALWIMTERPTLSILDSTDRHPGMRKRPKIQRIDFITALKYRQTEVETTVQNVFRADVKAISERREKDIKSLFNFVGIREDWQKINEWLKPGMMK